jgi:hypothetical protein
MGYSIIKLTGSEELRRTTEAQRPARGYFNRCTMWAGAFEKEFVTLTVQAKHPPVWCNKNPAQGAALERYHPF